MLCIGPSYKILMKCIEACGYNVEKFLKSSNAIAIFAYFFVYLAFLL